MRTRSEASTRPFPYFSGYATLLFEPLTEFSGSRAAYFRKNGDYQTRRSPALPWLLAQCRRWATGSSLPMANPSISDCRRMAATPALNVGTKGVRIPVRRRADVSLGPTSCEMRRDPFQDARASNRPTTARRKSPAKAIVAGHTILHACMAAPIHVNRHRLTAQHRCPVLSYVPSGSGVRSSWPPGATHRRGGRF
jgi:hypothetical protein